MYEWEILISNWISFFLNSLKIFQIQKGIKNKMNNHVFLILLMK